MSIPVITNFKINLAAPVDDRLVVTNSSERDAIIYKYDGLTVFQTDTRVYWKWNDISATWSYDVSGNGIYGGSGSIIGDTYINLNSINTSASAGTTSNILGYYSNLTGGSNVYYLNTVAVKKSSSPTSPLSFKIQNSLNSTNYSYIEFNPDSSDVGSLGFGNNNTEYLRISNTGNLNLFKGNLILWSPTYSATFDTTNLGANRAYTLPNSSGTIALTSDLASYVTASSIEYQSVAVSTSNPTGALLGTVKYRYNSGLHALCLSGAITTNNAQAFNNAPGTVYQIACTIPTTVLRPSSDKYFLSQYFSPTDLSNYSNTEYIDVLKSRLTSSGQIQIAFKKPSSGVSAYSIVFDVVIPY